MPSLRALTGLLRHIAERSAQSDFAVEERDLAGERLQQRALNTYIHSVDETGTKWDDRTLPEPTGPMMQMRSPARASKSMLESENDVS